jgi:gluconolactonase
MRALILFCLPLALLSQDFSSAKVEKVASGYKFTEGPVWSRDGYLLFSDVPNNTIQKFTPGKGSVVFRENSNGANGNTLDAQGRLYTCESQTRRVIRTNKNGNIEVLAERYGGKRLNAPNDIVVRRDGHVYFTDPAFGPAQEKGRELDFFGIYHITPKGELKLIAKTKGRPNGVTLSPNGRILYVADSDERILRAFDLARDGEASNERVFVKDIDGPPDGIRTDEKGNIYVTANRIYVYSPDGKQVANVEFPEIPRNCAFGDVDFQGLYVTALTSLYRVRLDVKGSVQY